MAEPKYLCVDGIYTEGDYQTEELNSDKILTPPANFTNLQGS